MSMLIRFEWFKVIRTGWLSNDRELRLSKNSAEMNGDLGASLLTIESLYYTRTVYINLYSPSGWVAIPERTERE